MTTIGYLHFGGAFCNSPNGPMQTLSADVKTITPPRFQATSDQIATKFMVKLWGRWRRVYRTNPSIEPLEHFIGPRNAPLAKVSILLKETSHHLT